MASTAAPSSVVVVVSVVASDRCSAVSAVVGAVDDDGAAVEMGTLAVVVGPPLAVVEEAGPSTMTTRLPDCSVAVLAATSVGPEPPHPVIEANPTRSKYRRSTSPVWPWSAPDERRQPPRMRGMATLADRPLEYFRYEHLRDHVVRITINRPEVRNAVNTPAHKEWSDLLDLAAADDDVWIVVITGAGDQAFCAGRDLKHTSMINHASPAEREADEAMMASATRLIERFDYPKPLIAAVNGVALGGGFEVAMACDLVVAADHARFGLPEVRRGIYAGGGGVHRLPRQIPLKLAMEIMLTGSPITAARALEIGIVNRVVPAADLHGAVDELIDDILLGAPLSIQATKQAAMRGLDMALPEAFGTDYPAVARMRASDDAREGPRAFAEKRTPTWTGR